MNKNQIVDMPLSIRARNVLRRAGIRSIADLEKYLSTKSLMDLKGCGKRIANEIHEISRPYMNLAATANAAERLVEPSKPTVFGRLLTEAEMRLMQSISIDSMRISVRAHNVLETLGFKTAADVATANLESLISAHNMGVKSIANIQYALKTLQDESPAQKLLRSSSIESIHMLVEALLEQLDERRIQVLKDRYGLWDGQDETLEDISGKLGVTRERIRQIQKAAELNLRKLAGEKKITNFLINVIQNNPALILGQVHGVISQAEAADMNTLWAAINLKTRLSLDFLLKIFGQSMQVARHCFKQEANNLLFVNSSIAEQYKSVASITKRLLMSSGKPIPLDRVAAVIAQENNLDVAPDRIRRWCDLSDTIGVDDTGAVCLRHWTHYNAKTIPEMAQRALLEIDEPAHFQKIVDKMNFLYPQRAPFNVTSVHNQLVASPELFIGVARGTYGLSNWGITRPPFIKDFLASTMRLHKDPLNEGVLIKMGVEKYGYKEVSIKMTLQMNPLMFRSVAGGMWKLL